VLLIPGLYAIFASLGHPKKVKKLKVQMAHHHEVKGQPVLVNKVISD
jgi:hypothetical protein